MNSTITTTVVPSSDRWSWPMRGIPRLHTCGRFLLDDRDFQHRYWQTSTIAIHLYDYHARFRLDGVEFPIIPDVITISPLESETRYHLDAPGNHWCVHFAPAMEPGPQLELPVVQHLGARAAYVRERFARMALLFDQSQSSEHPRQVAAGAVLQEILCWLAATSIESLPVVVRSDFAVEHAAELLRGDFTREWTVPGLAQAVGLSPNYLAARFRQHFAMTIARYRLVQRIHDARRLLSGSDVPVGEVARRVGIPDPHHFNKLFRRIAGVPPSAARKKAAS